MTLRELIDCAEIEDIDLWPADQQEHFYEIMNMVLVEAEEKGFVRVLLSDEELDMDAEEFCARAERGEFTRH